MSNSKSPEEIIKDFYKSEKGWKVHEDGITEDTKLFVDLRAVAQDYNTKARLRLLNYLPEQGKYILDAGSGPIPHPEYLEYSRNFTKRYCADVSQDALEIAKEKIGNHGEYLNRSILDIDLPNDFFDAVISLHVLYHIDKNLQEKAVRNLLRMAKKDQPVIIVYRNPKSIFDLFGVIDFLKTIVKKIINWNKEHELYYFAHELNWWKRFENVAEVEMYPCSTLDKKTQELLIPNNKIGKLFIHKLFNWENNYQSLFTAIGIYTIVVLTKK